MPCIMITDRNVNGRFCKAGADISNVFSVEIQEQIVAQGYARMARKRSEAAPVAVDQKENAK